MTPEAKLVMARLTSDELRKLADQVDAYAAMKHAGANHPPTNTVLAVEGRKLAYLHWWDSADQFMAEFISFTPGDAEPLDYHEEQS